MSTILNGMHSVIDSNIFNLQLCQTLSGFFYLTASNHKFSIYTKCKKVHYENRN